MPDADLQPLRVGLYDLFRDEQSVAAGPRPVQRELDRILDLAQSAYGELVGALAGHPDAVLDGERDGEWTLRDILRHAIAVELRYGAQIEYSATRRDTEPLGIPAEGLPCDRLAPPEPAFAMSRTGGIKDVLDLLGMARHLTDERLASVTDDDLERPSLWGTRELTVRMRAHQIAVHLTECVLQSDKCLARYRSSEAGQIVRHMCAVRGAHERWSSSSVRAALDARYMELATK